MEIVNTSKIDIVYKMKTTKVETTIVKPHKGVIKAG